MSQVSQVKVYIPVRKLTELSLLVNQVLRLAVKRCETCGPFQALLLEFGQIRVDKPGPSPSDLKVRNSDQLSSLLRHIEQ